MTRLVGSTPESTFGDVITTTNSGQGLPESTPVAIQDGLGNNSSISMSQSVFNVNTTSGHEFQISGVALTASADVLNQVSNKFLQARVTVNTTAFTNLITFNLDPYSPSGRHFLGVEFILNAFRTNAALVASAVTTSPIVFFASQSDSGIEIIGETSGMLFDLGLVDPEYRIITSGNTFTIQVRELTSDVNSTLWTINYNLVSGA